MSIKGTKNGGEVRLKQIFVHQVFLQWLMHLISKNQIMHTQN